MPFYFGPKECTISAESGTHEQNNRTNSRRQTLLSNRNPEQISALPHFAQGRRVLIAKWRARDFQMRTAVGPCPTTKTESSVHIALLLTKRVQDLSQKWQQHELKKAGLARQPKPKADMSASPRFARTGRNLFIFLRAKRSSHVIRREMAPPQSSAWQSKPKADI